MTDSELDALVAERIMGWKVFAGEPGQGRPPSRLLSLVLEPIPPYTTDLNACHAMEAELERRGLVHEYIKALCDITRIDGRVSSWRLAHATARQRVVAGLKACGVEVEGV